MVTISKTPPSSDTGAVNRVDAEENSQKYVDPKDVGEPATPVPPVVTGDVPYEQPVDAVLGFYIPHLSVGLDTGSNSYVMQSAKDQCNILNILSNYQKTGILNHTNPTKPDYVDLPEQHDYQQALALVQEGESAFASLPSNVRKRFNNSPGEFLAAISDPKLHDELVELGIFERPANVPPPAPAPPQNPPSEE